MFNQTNILSINNLFCALFKEDLGFFSKLLDIFQNDLCSMIYRSLLCLYLFFYAIIRFYCMATGETKFSIFEHFVCCQKKVVVALLFSSICIKPEHEQPQSSHSRIFIEFCVESNELRLYQRITTTAILTKAETKSQLCIAGVITSSAYVSKSSIILLFIFLL